MRDDIRMARARWQIASDQAPPSRDRQVAECKPYWERALATPTTGLADLPLTVRQIAVATRAKWGVE